MRSAHVAPPSRGVCGIGHKDFANRPPLEVCNPGRGNDSNPFGSQQRHRLFPARVLRIQQNHRQRMSEQPLAVGTPRHDGDGVAPRLNES